MDIRTLSDVTLQNLEFGETGNGNLKADFAVANDQQGQDGEEFANWTNCTAYGYLARMLKNNKSEGRRVSLSGEMDFWLHNGDQYEKLVVNSLRYVDSASQASGQGGGSQQSSQQAPGGQSGGGQDTFDMDGEDDDLPF
jgi:single-stranded DNA-binding protein